MVIVIIVAVIFVMVMMALIMLTFVMADFALVLTVIPFVLIDLALIVMDGLLVGLPVSGIGSFILPQRPFIGTVRLNLLVVLLNLLADLRPGRSAEHGKGE